MGINSHDNREEYEKIRYINRCGYERTFRMNREQLREYEQFCDYLQQKTGAFFWYRPKDGQHIDIRMRTNVFKNCMERGATLADLKHVVDMHTQADGFPEFDYRDKRYRLLNWFTKKRFWRWHALRDGWNE